MANQPSPDAQLPQNQGSSDKNQDAVKQQPITQEKRATRPKWWPEWAQQLPYFSLPESQTGFSLIDRVKMRQSLEIAGVAAPAAIDAINKDLDWLEKELMPMFQQLDMEAKRQQNRYRLIQISFIFLAMLATILGSLLALGVGSAPRFVPVLAFFETLVALVATFIATISGRDNPPLGSWLDNRRRAETLRREYFRFLMNLTPYNQLNGYERQLALAERAALINQGTIPDDSVGVTTRPLDVALNNNNANLNTQGGANG